MAPHPAGPTRTSARALVRPVRPRRHLGRRQDDARLLPYSPGLGTSRLSRRRGCQRHDEQAERGNRYHGSKIRSRGRDLHDLGQQQVRISLLVGSSKECLLPLLFPAFTGPMALYATVAAFVFVAAALVGMAVLASTSAGTAPRALPLRRLFRPPEEELLLRRGCYFQASHFFVRSRRSP